MLTPTLPYAVKTGRAPLINNEQLIIRATKIGFSKAFRFYLFQKMELPENAPGTKNRFLFPDTGPSP